MDKIMLTSRNQDCILGSTRPSKIADSKTHQQTSRYLETNESRTSNSRARHPQSSQKRSHEKGNGNDLFQSDSPRSRKIVRSFLLNFMNGEEWTISETMDLHQHSIDTGIKITNTILQEVCVMNPKMKKLILTGCEEVNDVGLWVISRHCTGLREVYLRECDDITNIGLRSLVMSCPKIHFLDLTGCAGLDDQGLRVIAPNLRHLETLLISECDKVTDNGVSAIAQCCRRLKILRMRNCEKIGEFGDRALIEIGKSCHDLKVLDLYGCQHVSDPGIRYVGKGCPLLEECHLSGCANISGDAIRALATGCKWLIELSIAKCSRLTDADVCHIAKECQYLIQLNLSQNDNISANSLGFIAKNSANLQNLNLSHCSSVNDNAMESLSRGCTSILSLTVAGCRSISERGIEKLVTKCPQISFLDLSECRRIGRSFPYRISNLLPFSDVSSSHFGFEPNPDEINLRIKADQLKKEIAAAICMQRFIRGAMTRGGEVLELRKDWIVKHRLPKVQSLIRGIQQRTILNESKLQCRYNEAATKIKRAYKGSIDRRVTKQIILARREISRNRQATIKMQKTFRGHKGRQRVKKIRNYRASRRLQEAKVQARREMFAIVIQRDVRRYLAQKILFRMIQERNRIENLRLQCEQSAESLQKVFRGFLGRQRANRVKAEDELYKLQILYARKLQSIWRGVMGRGAYKVRKLARDHERVRSTSMLLQRNWRGRHGRQLAKIARSIERLQKLEHHTAIKIQRIFRGKVGRFQVSATKAAILVKLARNRSAIKMQKVFRGHKGREEYAVRRALKDMEFKARPLLRKLQEEDDFVRCNRASQDVVRKTLERAETVVKILEKEIGLITQSTCKYWDSDLIAGYPQRFIRGLLKTQLEEKLDLSMAGANKVKEKLLKIQTNEQEILRNVRNINRELVPLTTGVTEKTVIERSTRLRHKIVRERSASTCIQKNTRGWLIRSAFNSSTRDYWIEKYDSATEQNVFYNTLSQNKVFLKPAEMKLSQQLQERK